MGFLIVRKRAAAKYKDCAKDSGVPANAPLSFVKILVSTTTPYT
jgi:hypothetical protein